MMTSDGRIERPKSLRSRFPGSRARFLAFALTTALICSAIVLAQDDPAGKKSEPGVGLEDKPCLECHEEIVARKLIHGPVRQGCETCHVQKGKRHEFEPMTPEERCESCHELSLEEVVHAPVEKHLCATCHDPHSSDQPKLLRKPEQELCSSCHTDRKGGMKKYTHGPFAVGACQICHASHSSKNANLLRQPGRELCLGCHVQELPEDETAVRWHSPAEDDCTLCHSGHGSDTPGILRSPQPELCLKCHRSMRDTIENSPVRHAPVAQEGGCGNCHDPHFSTFTSLLKSDSADLCLTCHNREYPQKDGRPFPNMVQLLEENPNHHGPVREKNCEGCHEPHGSRHTRLLKEAYPPTFYTRFNVENFALCFMCHPKDLVMDKGLKTTNFSDGDRNLHFVHVNRKKGRTCRACHETHASKLPHHLRETTPFGNWDLPIGFKEAGDGGYCAPGCHSPMSYDGGR